MQMLLMAGTAWLKGSAEVSAAKAERAQLNYAAGQAEAASQHEAIAARRKADLMISRGLAVGAASGAGTSGLEGLMAGIAAEGETAAQGALYSGSEKAKGLRYRGALDVATARSSRFSSTIQSAATSTISSSGGSFFERFGDPAPIESLT